MTHTIRHARADDTDAIYRICLLTADAGDDGSHLYSNPRLPGHIWAGPYVALEPEHAFVLVDDDTPVGYVLGVVDSPAFQARAERDWWPRLREEFPEHPTPELIGDRVTVHLIHHPPRVDEHLVTEYPSHLHIDLLPVAQGRGDGRRMIERLLACLVDASSPGVQFGVSPRNQRAIGFYEAVGFDLLVSNEHHLVFGRRF